MHIQIYTPLQKCLETIHRYLETEEFLKARVAALALPLFEAIELYSLIREVFYPIPDKPFIPYSQQFTKACFLFLNIFISPYFGFTNPFENYRYHQLCHLTKDKKTKMGDVLDEALLEDRSPTPKNTREKTALDCLPSPTARSYSEIEHCKDQEQVQDLINKLRNAPRCMEKRTSFLTARKAITASVQTFLPESGRKKASPLKEEPMEALRVEDQELFSLLKSDAIPSPETSKMTSHSPLPQKVIVEPKKLHDGFPIDRLSQIKPLIDKVILRGGSWRASGARVYFRASNTFSIDPGVIDAVACAYNEGVLANLTFDQTFILNKNLEVISFYLHTIKSKNLGKFVELIEANQMRLLELWVKEDSLEGMLYSKCHLLFEKMKHLIEGFDGHENGHLRTFSEPTAAELLQLFENWQASTLSAQWIQKKDFSLFEVYQILQIYLSALPQEIMDELKPLRSATSVDHWKKQYQKLSRENQTLVSDLIQYLKSVKESIWKDDSILKAAHHMVELISPLHLHDFLAIP